MSALLWRVIYAVLSVLILFALIPALFRLFGLPLSADLWTVLRICIGGIALLYVFAGDKWPRSGP